MALYRHTIDQAAALTPRQLTALLALADERERHEAARKLALSALAAQGDGDSLRKAHRDLLKG